MQMGAATFLYKPILYNGLMDLLVCLPVQVRTVTRQVFIPNIPLYLKLTVKDISLVY